ncbi:hypothetical protein D3C75_1170960 [compost metagenome]
MVGCNHNGGVAVFLREINRCLDRGIEIERLLDKCRQIVGMTGMVNPSAFNHHDKTLFIR